ncbi:metalloproteinase inhibitor 3-like [Crassostrea angulata]|uniref:metalloproteinase inhibitor 3-like n=1 Tax=Magallana angulata TaxID=2784310 RepID=UPI0022B1A55B|nr:metalloproteinase inhibitor 3-like [Crassostrea angulata]
MKRLVFICVVLTFIFTNSEACSCASRHPQTQFCNSDFVITARILRRTATGSSRFDEVFYTVLILQNYKRRQHPLRHPVLRIYTASSGASCGAFFRIGREYIISGSIRSQKWKTHMCRWNRQLSSLTQFQRNALNFGYYRNNCSCIVSHCGFMDDYYYYSACTVPKKNECLIMNNKTCFYQNDSCIQYGRRCRWLSNQRAYRSLN